MLFEITILISDGERVNDDVMKSICALVGVSSIR